MCWSDLSYLEDCGVISFELEVLEGFAQIEQSRMDMFNLKRLTEFFNLDGF